jgi:hypothetical protein
MDSRLGWHEHNLTELGELSGRDTMANWRMRHGIETPERFQRWLLERETERMEREVERIREERRLEWERGILAEDTHIPAGTRSPMGPYREAPPALSGYDWPRFWLTLWLALMAWLALSMLAIGLYHALRLIIRLALYLPHA